VGCDENTNVCDDDDDDDAIDDNEVEDAEEKKASDVLEQYNRRDQELTSIRVDHDDLEHLDELLDENYIRDPKDFVDDEINTEYDDRLANLGTTLWSTFIDYSTKQLGNIDKEVIFSRVQLSIMDLEAARNDAFNTANFKDINPAIEGDFLRHVLHKGIHRVDESYLKSVAINQGQILNANEKVLDKAVLHWGSIREYYTSSLAETTADDIRSVSYILSNSKKFGVKCLFSSFDKKKALATYTGPEGANGQLGRPLLSAYNFFVGETPWGDELHTHIRVLKTFLDRILTIFTTLVKLKVPGVEFTAFRALCKSKGFDPKEKLFGKGWYFKNLSGDRAVILLETIIVSGSYLPQPYSLAIIDAAKCLRPLLAVYRSTSPLLDFDYTNINDLYNDAIVAPIRVLQRLLNLLFPNVIRLSGISAKTYCIGWHTRKFEDLIQEHAKQFISEVLLWLF
jgi:hypothetical protein